MSYCTAEDIIIAAGGEKRLGELADWNRDSVADSDVILSAMAGADAVIDSELGMRFAVPLAADDVTEAIKTIAMEEAVFILKRRRDMASEADRDDHDERMKALASMKVGGSTLGTDSQPAKSSRVVAAQTERPSDKATSRNSMKGFW